MTETNDGLGAMKEDPTMEETTKVGARQDDARKARERGDSRVEDGKQTQGIEEGEHLPTSGSRPDLDDVVDLSGVNERSDIARFLEPHCFPGDRAAMLAAAEHNHAPEDILETLSQLPEGRQFANVQDVWEALGGTVEERF